MIAGSDAQGVTSSMHDGPNPRRMRRHVTLIVLALIGLLLPPLANVPFLTTVLIYALLFGLMGAVFDFMIGYAGLSNFGFAGFLAIGAYTSALGSLHLGISPWFGLLLGGVFAALIGFATGVVTLRLRGLYLGLTTWFIAEMIRFTISNTPDITRGTLGLSVPPFPDLLGIAFPRGGSSTAYYYLLVVLGAVTLLALWLVVRSKIGLAFRAIREDQLATESLGISATKYKLLNFTIGTFFTGVLGSYYAHYLGILSPTPEEFGVTRTVEILTIAYVGGRGTLWGSLVAALLLVGVQEYFREFGAYRLLLFGSLLIVVVLFVPKGLAGIVNRWRRPHPAARKQRP
jgi:branched-chain amino acid transport system permease protein